MIEVAFWTLVGFVVFTFAGFPVLVIILGTALRRSHRVGDATPPVSILIAAYNEAGGIAAKLRNTLDQRYPQDRVEVVVVDDGSTDDTSHEIARIQHPRIRSVRLPRRGGKIAALNCGLPECRGEVIVLTDANAELEPDAVASLVAPFSDPEVGGVCGNQLNRPGRGALAHGERLYWEYDKFLKRMETRTGSIVAADGSIYAIRRCHVEPIPSGVTDDFYLSTAVIRDGARLVFEERARAIETPLERGRDHFRRRVRITEQAMASLAARRSLMNPFRYGVYALILIGHKLMRRLAAPAILCLVPVSAAAATQGPLYLAAAVLMGVLLCAAVLGWWLRGKTPARLLAAPFYIVLGIGATTFGMLRFLRGQRSVMWEPVRH